MTNDLIRLGETGQTRRDRPDEVQNAAGGFVFSVDEWARLDRYLILGSEGGTYYVNQEALTLENAMIVSQLVERDGLRVVERIVEISEAGRAPKNTPALFALAICTTARQKQVREAAYKALPRVARTGTHLLNWAQFSTSLKGTGSGWQRAIARWFNEKAPDQLAYQAVKYQQRQGWTMADLLRLAHVTPPDQVYDNIFKWIVDGWSWDALDEYPDEAVKPVPNVIWAYERAKGETDEGKLTQLIQSYRLPWEALPTESLRSPLIWEALLDANALPLEALLRNLGRMSSIDYLTTGSQVAQDIVSRITNAEHIAKSRLHPFKILVGMKTYAQGRGIKGSLSWMPVGSVVDALDKAFYLAFGNVTPTGKKLLLALDVSGSMTMAVSGMPLSCHEASAAMALVTASVEPNVEIVGFADSSRGYGYGSSSRKEYSNVYPGLMNIAITPRQRLDDVVAKISRMPMAGTDCAIPALYAYDKNRDVDGIVIYTDSETWAGHMKPYQALERYRNHRNPELRQVVVAMTSTGFTIADPKDRRSLDVVGLDTATPQLISDFIEGKM